MAAQQGGVGPCVEAEPVVQGGEEGGRVRRGRGVAAPARGLGGQGMVGQGVETVQPGQLLVEGDRGHVSAGLAEGDEGGGVAPPLQRQAEQGHGGGHDLRVV
nr:hypothetical protein [Brevundimonas denitrificans]